MSYGIYFWNHFDHFGPPFLYFTWSVWFTVTIVGYAICFHLFQAMIIKQTHSVENMSAAWMTPFVALVVDASAGSLLAQFIIPLSTKLAGLTVVWAFGTLIIGTTMCFLVMGIFVLRLIVHGYPPMKSIWSCFLPLSGMTQAGFTVAVLGDSWASLLAVSPGNSPVFADPASREVIRMLGDVTSLVFWFVSMAWLIWALMAAVTVQRGKFKFNIMVWSVSFPFGVLSLHTMKLGIDFDSPFFAWVGNIFTIIQIGSCLTLLIFTTIRFFQGTIFHSYAVEDESYVSEKSSTGAMEKTSGQQMSKWTSPKGSSDDASSLV